MRHDIERVHAAIASHREDLRRSEAVDHGDFVLVHAYTENWVPKLHGDWVCLYLNPPSEARLCQVVALSSVMQPGHAIFQEIVDGPQVDWPSDLADWRSGWYDVLPVDHGPWLSALIPLVLRSDVLRSRPIEFTLVCDKVPMPKEQP